MKKLRHELKYYINYRDYLVLRRKLQLFLKPDRHHVSEEGYQISSLYFDNAESTDLYEKNLGLYQRKKFRVRIYNHSDGIINLEKKSRYGEMVEKSSTRISKEVYYELLRGNYEVLASFKDNPMLKDFYLYTRANVMRPAVIVDYQREAYVDEFHDIRITFDKQLSASWNTTDLFDHAGVGREVLDDQVMILEVKYQQFWPDSLRALLQLESHERQAISKYVLCREERIKQFKE